MRRNPVLHPCSSTRAVLLALGFAVSPAMPALAGSEGGPAAATPVRVAQITGLPTSPAFHMNLSSNAPGDLALPIGSHDSPAKGAPARFASASGARPAVAHAVPGGVVSDIRAAAARPAVDRASLPASATAPISAINLASNRTSTSTPASAPAASPPSASAPIMALTSGRPASAAASNPKATPTSIDPFEHLRERLAQTLGATTAGPNSKYVLRVSTHGESGENVVSTARGDRVATMTTRRTAARASSAAASQVGADASSAAHPDGWDYAGSNGPESWGRLQPEFDKCAHGARQSPIDLRDGIAVDLEAIQFDYRPGTFSVIDTGHTVQVNVAPGSAITIQGRRFELEQFHFHRPSEERIDGRQFDMTVHLVHKDAQGRLAVIAVLLQRGSALPIVQTVWNNLPLEKNDELRGGGPLDPAQLLPSDRRYYTYMGSLTTPPCTEGVLWMVMKNPVEISVAQDAIFARLYPMNARPVQAAAGRLVKESN